VPYILVVDDEEAIRGLISFNLVREGFEVDTAATGPETLDKISVRHPDLIILDWMLPELSGLDVCRQLKGRVETEDIPVIMLTAKTEEKDKVLGFEMGVDDYMTKPFSPRELTARVKAHLRGRVPQHHQEERVRRDILRLEDLYLDKDKYLALKSGQDLELSPREFDLLFLLACNPGRVFRREELLERLWGYDLAAGTRTVDVHIRKLRAKVEEEPQNPRYLLTVRGVGYKFRKRQRWS
jgi:DNA-binding response OmpR family regulator